MDDQEKALCLYLIEKQRKRRRKRTIWVHPLNIQRPITGAFISLFAEVRSDQNKFFNYFRMSVKSFDELLGKVEDGIKKENTKMRDAIPAIERLAVTIRYLASGNSFTDLHYTYRMGSSTISKIVNDVCDVLWKTLLPECIPPLTTERLEKIAKGFQEKTQFPHCVGAVDGKHVRIINPAHSVSVYFNYKEFFSIILLAVVDSEYQFIFVDIGAYGKDSDSTIFKSTKFWTDLIDGSLPLPKPKPLGTIVSEVVPYVLVGDEGFGIHSNLMRPFANTSHSIAKRVFNYRLCRSRRYVECAFGILSNKWRIFHRPLNVKEELTKKIVKACCVLHNFVRVRDGYNFEDILTVVGFEDVEHAVIRRGKKHGEDVRKVFARYFISDEGSVPWQNKMI